ncbi:MAG: alpha/beta fold hydrolase [Rhodocyclaceae bacterium]|nr:alpha/beta fold hydrolase [Rhodocyclaceae bacterium]
MTPLTLFTGWGMDPGVWDALAESLPHFDCRRPRLDWACRGGLEGLADTLAATLPPAAPLAGWSLGAMLALCVAARHPQRCSALLLIGATPRFCAAADWPHGVPAGLLEDFRAQLGHAPAALLQRFCGLQARGEGDARGATRALRAHADTGAATTHLAAGLDLLEHADLRPLLPQIAQPVLLLHGSDDSIIPPAAAHYCAQHLPRAALAEIAATGHAPHLSKPALVAAHLQDWLQELHG